MASVVNAGDIKRSDVFILDPNEIYVNEADRGRFTPPLEEQIIDLALSILEYGQIQPVECRKIEGNRLKLTMGYTRMAAIRLIREGFTYEGETYHDPLLRIKCMVTNHNEEVAFKHNIVENQHRNQTSPIDDAHNQERLRDKYGMADRDIAKLYGMQSNQIARLTRLLSLDKSQQELVHSGSMSVDAAITLLDAPEDKRAGMIAAAIVNGKVKGTAVKNQVRDHHLRDANPPVAPGAPAPKAGTYKAVPRSIRDVREFFEAEALGEGYKARFAGVMVSYIKGEVQNDVLMDAFNGITNKKTVTA